MATVVRVSGTVDNTPKGNTTLSAPEGNIVLDAPQTVATGEFTAKDVVVEENLYTNYIKSKLGNIQIAPNQGLTEVIGDIRVQGTNPIGTAPVVTNVLYVTEDGDDTNDGRAMDPSRACRTIGAALKSPYYQPGTQIRVSPGHYLENNPLQLKPYTSIMGSDLRTTSVEPINKTQDLFHLTSGCYLAFMQFTNGRSGLLEGQYAPGYNRGAYATAFPPLSGNDRIDLFHSPYVQNCTNQSGPWLKDGTMFVPDYTVQVPAAVGIGTWTSNTTSIVISVSTGTITQGMSINAGNQHPGFWNARTLLLANKLFLQEQVSSYISQQYPLLSYNQAKSFRDVGILVENVAYDAAFGGNEKSVESGLAYYNGVISLIPGLETQCIAGINYLNSLAQQIVTNTTATDILSGAGLYHQVINTALVDGDIVSSSLDDRFGIITGIISGGTGAAPAVYKSTGPDADFASAEILLQANRQYIQEQTINYINNNLTNRTLKYNQIKCARDTGLIVDSIATDLLYSTSTFSQSTFAGIQYYAQNGYTGNIPSEINQTIGAITYLKTLAAKIIQNVTVDDDALVGVTRYQSAVGQVTDPNGNIGTASELGKVGSEFDIILEILNGNTQGWTDQIVSNGLPSNLPSIQNAVTLLQSNKSYFAAEVLAYIGTTYPGFSYNQATCARDVGYIIDSISFDLRNGGNKQAIQSGLYYYTDIGGASVIPSETTATVAAFNFMASVIDQVVQNSRVSSYQTGTNIVRQITSLPAATSAEVVILNQAISTVTSILLNGIVTGVNEPSPVTFNSTPNQNQLNAFNILLANREFIVAETIAWLEANYNPGAFQYNQALCYRDTGLIIDAVSQDILLGGNSKSLEAGLAYWNQGYNYVSGQESRTVAALNYARDIALQCAANQTVTDQSGTVAQQVINSFFTGGGDYAPQAAIRRNFGIITNIIQNGPLFAPPLYQGGGISIATGALADDVRIAPKVTRVDSLGGNQYLVGLSTSTVGFGTNATLYFGNTYVVPKQDFEVEALSLQYTSNTTTWAIRKLDPIGAMGGSLVDGDVISDRSPIQSFVYDAYTQVTQGGRGIYITNSGYAQLVSVFTIFCSVGVQADNGGIASITNSNCNFGELSLVAKGYGKRSFSGTVFNPSYRAYPFSPNLPGSQSLDQYYPNGYWPNRGNVEIFVPDTANRPHISLVMEVVPPTGYVNDQSLPGFLTASPSTSTLVAGTINLTGISTADVAVGNTLYILDQFGYPYDNFPYIHDEFGNYLDSSGQVTTDPGQYIANPNYQVRYVTSGTQVTDINYNSITLNSPINAGGGFADNPNYFNLYFCGNAYYTVQTSQVANNPYRPNLNILSANTDLNYQGPTVDQVSAHADSINHLRLVVDQIIANQPVTVTTGNAGTQVVLNSVTGGAGAQAFIDLRFGYLTTIITATNITVAETVVPQSAITKTGTIPSGAGSAVTLITSNIDFMTAEVVAYVNQNYGTQFSGSMNDYQQAKCARDVGLILQQLIYDLETGGNYNMVYAGLSYWGRTGTYHIVELGEAVTNTNLFPDGAIVNFYQRSYISASGYLFEYVGAGTNYGALPQVGNADPVQSQETVQLNGGKVFFTSTDQNGDFRIGTGLVISQATGVLSGRTFTQSLFANMTPFILAIEGL
jgi:hypothetical protein